MGQAEDQEGAVAALAVAVLGMRDGMAGQLDQGFGAAVRRGFGEHIPIGIGLAGKARDRGGDDHSGFGVEPAVEAPHALQRFGQAQPLRRPFFRRLGFGRFRSGRREQFGGDGFQLFDGEPGGVCGEEPFHVQREVVVLLADRAAMTCA